MRAFFQALLYDPIFNIFVGLYNIIPDLGVVIVVLTIFIKVVLYPLTSSSIKAQKSLTELQPKLNALKVTYKNDQQRLAQETMKLYKEHKVNPLGSCLPILVQLPIFLALFYVLRSGITSNNFDALYPFVSNPGSINPISLGLVDLGKRSIVLAILAGAAQFWQAKMFSHKKPPKEAGTGAKDEGMAAMMNKQMLYMMPFLTVIIGLQFPAGLSLYWFLSTLLTGLQQMVLFKKKKSDSSAVEGELVS
ncbi:MAG: membrane protein insertase YidC [Candidatus Magasanikbacteria bacterium]|nr:membrane protein insertase YidC [Candidatus Magasanikbacteria bacterium]